MSFLKATKNIMANILKKGVMMTVLTPLSANAATTASTESALAKTLARPLIVGASVSADRATASPGKRLALRYTKPTEIKTFAIGGMPSIKVLPSLRPKDLQDRSIVIGLDLFFWDSTLASPKASIQAMEELIERTEKLKIPLVLGEVPELLPSMQPSRNSLNQAIHKHCAASQNCYVMKLDTLLKQVLNDGYLEIKGRKYTLPELVPDGLHLGNVAGEDLANRLALLLEQK